MERKKPDAIFQYNKFIEDVDNADQYLRYYSVLKKTAKWSKIVVLYLLNCVLFNVFFCVQDAKYKQSKVQELLTRGRKILHIRSPESK